jgi:DNA-binding MarR family transcriptional regulator
MKGGAGREPRISYLVKRVERGLRLGLDEALSHHGVTTPEYTVLSVLGARDGLSSAQLARRAFVTAQAMNQIVIGLERGGLIQRRPSETQGRSMCASLTAEGAALLAVCNQATLHVEQQLLAGLSPSQLDALRRTLCACIDSLDGAIARVASTIERPALPARRRQRRKGSRCDVQ